MPSPARVAALRLREVVRSVGVTIAAVRAPRREPRTHGSLGRGVALRGTVWPGGDAEPYDGVVLVGPDGDVDRIGPPAQVPIPVGVRVIGAAHTWVGPGIVDAHVRFVPVRVKQRARPLPPDLDRWVREQDLSSGFPALRF